MADLAGDLHHRRREIDVALGAVELDVDAALGLDAAELRQEVDVEIGAPELAVGDAAQAEVLLELDDVANRLVLDAREAVAAEMAPVLNCSRASSRNFGRRKLPT